MTVYFYETNPSRKVAKGKESSEESNFVLWSTAGEVDAKADALAYVLAGTVTISDGLVRQGVDLDEVDVGLWQAKVKYGVWKPPEVGDYDWSFDTTGGTAKQTQSKQNIGNYAPAGEVAPNFRGAVGVSGEGDVEGVDIKVPKFRWQETHQLDSAVVTWTYSQILKALTGRTNDASFRGFSRGEVMFGGAKASSKRKEPGIVEVTYEFDAESNATNLTVGQITVPSKKGWEYLWVRYEPKVDAAAKRLVKQPSSAHVERMSDEADFSLLGIGG